MAGQTKTTIPSGFKPEDVIGKVIATRGQGSGVNMGRCVYFDNNIVVLTDSFFMKHWTYSNSCGSFHSMSTADITGGEHIVRVKFESVLMDVAQFVICPDEALELARKYATVK